MDDQNRDQDRDMAQRGLGNQLEGSAREAEGKVRGDVGDAVDNASEHLKGRAKEAQGKIQKNVGKMEERLSRDKRDPEDEE